MNELSEINCDVTGEEAVNWWHTALFTRWVPPPPPPSRSRMAGAINRPFDSLLLYGGNHLALMKLSYQWKPREGKKGNRTERNKWCGYYGKSAVDIANPNRLSFDWFIGPVYSTRLSRNWTTDHVNTSNKTATAGPEKQNKQWKSAWIDSILAISDKSRWCNRSDNHQITLN